MTTSRKFKLRALAASLLMTAGISVAHAGASPSSLFVGGTLNNLSDDGSQLWVDRNSTGKVDVGDWLVSFIGFNRVNDVISGTGTAIGQGTAYNELTAVFATEVASKAAAGGCGAAASCFSYGFKAVSHPNSIYYALANLPGVSSGLLPTTTTGSFTAGANTVGLMFEDSSNDFRIAGTKDQVASSATNGTLRLVLDMADESKWNMLGPEKLSDYPAAGVFAGSYAINPGGIAVSNRNQGFTGWTLEGLFGSGQLQTGTRGTAFPVRNDTTIYFGPGVRVSEPATLGLFGVALAGLSVLRRRKVKA